MGGNSGGFPITKGYHQLTHHGKVESYIDELSVIERYHTNQFARFLDQLAAVEEPGGKTLLDSTMALLGSGMGNVSSHSNKDLPLLLAGVVSGMVSTFVTKRIKSRYPYACQQSICLHVATIRG